MTQAQRALSSGRQINPPPTNVRQGHLPLPSCPKRTYVLHYPYGYKSSRAKRPNMRCAMRQFEKQGMKRRRTTQARPKLSHLSQTVPLRRSPAASVLRWIPKTHETFWDTGGKEDDGGPSQTVPFVSNCPTPTEHTSFLSASSVPSAVSPLAPSPVLG